MKLDSVVLLLFAVLALAGCASSPKAPAVRERGWIGGEFQQAGRDLTPPGQRARVYAREVHPETPASRDGMASGDLLLELDGRRIENLTDLRTRLDAARPGQTVVFAVLRDGQRLELPVTVGRERYRRWNTLSLGLRLSSKFDMWPNPDFSLLPVTSFERVQDRLELKSTESKLRKAARHGQTSEGWRSNEGWNYWLVVLGVGRHHEILSQELSP